MTVAGNEVTETPSYIIKLRKNGPFWWLTLHNDSGKEIECFAPFHTYRQAESKHAELEAEGHRKEQ